MIADDFGDIAARLGALCFCQCSSPGGSAELARALAHQAELIEAYAYQRQQIERASGGGGGGGCLGGISHGLVGPPSQPGAQNQGGGLGGIDRWKFG